MFARIANQGDDVLALLVDGLENVGGEFGGYQVVRRECLLGRLSVLGSLGVNEVLQVLRVVVIFALVVEVETVIDVVACAVLRVDNLQSRDAVKVQVHAVLGLVAVVVGYDNIDLLVSERVNLGFAVLDGEVEGIVVLEGLVIPDLGGVLSAGVQVDLDAHDGSEGVASKNREGDVAVVAGPQGVLGNRQARLGVDNSDPGLAGGRTGSVGGVIAVKGDKFGLVESRFGVGPGLRLGVAADDGRVLAVLVGEGPLESVDLVDIVGEKANHVHGVVNRDCKRVGDGVGFHNGRVGHRVGKCLRIRDGFVKHEDTGVVVLQVHVFLDGRFPGTAEKNHYGAQAKGKQQKLGYTHSTSSM